MKFLVDENLPPALAKWLATRGHDATHVTQLNLGGRPDTEIIATAEASGFVIITQDSDYDAIAADAPRVLRLALGNAPTAKLLEWLEPKLDDAIQRLGAERLVVIA